MKIVIAGAGSVGYHLSKLLCIENQDITLIDKNEKVLEGVQSALDVMTVCGNACSSELLKESQVGEADLFIAVTTSEETNLLSAILAKQKGAKTTIARVTNDDFLSSTQKAYFKQIGIDKIFSPNKLAVNEITRLLKRASLTDIFDFENGEISVVGFTLDNNSNLVNKTIADIGKKDPSIDYRGVALLRGHKTLIPRGNTKLLKADHLYLSLKSKNLDNFLPMLGKETKPINNVMIIGDSLLALNTAKALQESYSVKLILTSEDIANQYLDELDNTLVIVGDPSSKDLLEEEGMNNMDAFIALTVNSEVNILSSLLAEESGVYKTIAKVDNDVYTHISQNIGIDTLINKKIIAANNIFRYVRKGTVEAIATLHGVDAEIIEFQISDSNKKTHCPIGDLKLPKSSIVAGVIRDEEGIIPNGDFVLTVNDKLIVFALPDSINKIEEIFK